MFKNSLIFPSISIPSLAVCALAAGSLAAVTLTPRNPAVQKVPATGTTFVHPGILLGPEQLAELWNSDVMTRSPRKEALAAAIAESEKYKNAVATPNNTTTNYVPTYSDADHAYLNAVLFEATGDEKYAIRAQGFLKPWIDDMSLSAKQAGYTTWVNNNTAYLMWSLPLMSGAVDLLSSTWKKWDPALTTKYGNFCNNLVVPSFKAWLQQRLFSTRYHHWMNNFHTALTMSLAGIAVIRNDMALMDYSAKCFTSIMEGTDSLVNGKKAIDKKGRVINDRYIVREVVEASDLGVTTEGTRDNRHAVGGVFHLTQFAELAYIQSYKIKSQDVYAYDKNILLTATEYLASHYHQATIKVREYNVDNAGYLEINNNVKHNSNGPTPGYDLPYRHYTVRKGLAMPKTKAILATLRPELPSTSWGLKTLTHSYVNVPVSVEAVDPPVRKVGDLGVDVFGRPVRTGNSALRIHQDGTISVNLDNHNR